MSNIQIFNNPQFGSVRTVSENGNVLFCGSDVAKALGYLNPQKAIRDHCKGGTERNVQHPQSADKQLSMVFIPESDLYRLVVKSQLSDAEKFERWVFEEVLPSVRQTGAYMTPETIEKVLLNPDTIITLATQIKELQAKVQQDAPKVLFANAVTVSDKAILIGELAKILKGNGIDMGQNRLFERLRNDGFLIKRKGTDYNMPTQRAMEMGLFKVKETAITHSDGHVTVSKTAKITGKGQQYFINRFLGK